MFYGTNLGRRKVNMGCVELLLASQLETHSYLRKLSSYSTTRHRRIIRHLARV